MLFAIIFIGGSIMYIRGIYRANAGKPTSDYYKVENYRLKQRQDHYQALFERDLERAKNDN